MHKLISILLLSGLVMIGCKKTKQVATQNAESKPTKETQKPVFAKKAAAVEDFDSFYNKFHSDSMFQMSRVKFPLQGYDMDTSEQVQKWTPDNWLMHRAKVSDVDTTIYDVKVDSGHLIRKEKVFIAGGGFNLERVFKRINGKWYLTLFVNEEM